MTEEEWLACADPVALVRFLRHNASARKLRLFACAHARYQYGSAGELGQAIDIAERWADEGRKPDDLGSCANYYVCFPHAWQAADEGTAASVAAWAESSHKQRAVRFLITSIRCIFGNPFRPAALDPSWLTSTVVLLGRGIYEERAFDRLPILADALQDAGCDNADVLDHCRGPGPHVRGCWVVDLVLGKE
jgi:hypothetical protein